MKMNYKILPALALGLAISLSCTSSAIAADAAGYGSGTQKVLSNLPLKNGLSVTRVASNIGLSSDAHEGLFHGATQQCLATIVSGADGSVIEGHGSCDGIDPDGDVWWISLSIGGDGPYHWSITGGTGKYKGLAMSGVSNVVAEHDDGIVVFRFEGNYEH